MQFVNLTDKTLRFSIGGAAFAVEPMGECDVPDAFTYAVKGYGLPLTPKADVEPAAPAAKTPAPAAPAASATSPEESTVSSAESASTTDNKPQRRGR